MTILMWSSLYYVCDCKVAILALKFRVQGDLLDSAVV